MENRQPRTEAQICQLALDVQDACNLSGVAQSLAQVTLDLWVIARERNLGTEFVNTHPAVALFLDKLQDLNRRQDFSKVWDAVAQIIAHK